MSSKLLPLALARRRAAIGRTGNSAPAARRRGTSARADRRERVADELAELARYRPGVTCVAAATTAAATDRRRRRDRHRQRGRRPATAGTAATRPPVPAAAEAAAVSLLLPLNDASVRCPRRRAWPRRSDRKFHIDAPRSGSSVDRQPPYAAVRAVGDLATSCASSAIAGRRYTSRRAGRRVRDRVVAAESRQTRRSRPAPRPTA